MILFALLVVSSVSSCIILILLICILCLLYLIPTFVHKTAVSFDTIRNVDKFCLQDVVFSFLLTQVLSIFCP